MYKYLPIMTKQKAAGVTLKVIERVKPAALDKFGN
jgi:hypothetical protein